MFYHGNWYLIIILLTCVEKHRTSLQESPLQEGKHNIINDNFNKFLRKQKMTNEYNFKKRIFVPINYNQLSIQKESPEALIPDDNIVNKFSFIGDELFNSYDTNPDDTITNIKEIDYPSEILDNIADIKDYYIQNENSLKTQEKIYENHDHNILDNTSIYRREVLSDSNMRNSEKSSLYPSVLTKALEISLNPTNPSNSHGNILANVAQKLNTSTLDLAQQLTKTKNPQDNDKFATMIQGYLKSKGKTILK